MNFKKRVNGSWTDIPHYIHNTFTDTLTTLPADIYANDTTATVGLKGNMSQTGTPTPTTPIQPSECGDRTGNLIDIEDLQQIGWAYDLRSLVTQLNNLPIGEYKFTVSFELTVRNDTSDASRYGYTFINSGGNISNLWTWGTADVGAINAQTISIVVTESNKNKFTNCYFYGCGIVNQGRTGYGNVYNFMLNTGSTALPYEPYGYKIPILNNSTTTNIYLGETQTTRRIKKVIFDGTEDWNNQYVSDSFNIQHAFDNMPFIPKVLALSTNYIYSSIQESVSYNLADGKFALQKTSVGLYNIILKDSRFTALQDFTNWLAQQYVAGTPVTIWYVLENPTTGIVNEPLRKIGDYADEVSGITIPTIAGANTISVGTTLQPSEVTVNYKGWHPVADVHERENGAWD